MKKFNNVLQNRWLLLAVSSVHVIATSGVVFGFAGLQHTLQLEGAFSQTCENGQKTCEKQSSLLNLMFVLGSSANYLSNIPFGYILDRFGPKACSIVASLSYLVGTVCMILAALAKVIAAGLSSSAAANYLEYLYFVGFILFGFAGPGVQVPTFHISNLFANSSLIIAVNTALFDASTMIFFLMQLVHEYLHMKVYFIFLIYAILICFIFVSGAILWPNYTFEKQSLSQGQSAKGVVEEIELAQKTAAAEEEGTHSFMASLGDIEAKKEAEEEVEELNKTLKLEGGGVESEQLAEMQAKVIEHELEEVDLTKKGTEPTYMEEHAVVGETDNNHLVVHPEEASSPISPASASLHDQPFIKQLLSPVYPYVIMFGAFQILRLNFFVATIDAQLKYNFGTSSSLPYTLKLIFEILLPFGFVGIPVMSYLLNKSLFLSFLFVNIFALTYGVAFLIPVHVVLVIGFAVFSTCRQFVFSAIFTAIADKFGYKHFGKLIGINNLGVALFGLLQYPLVELVYRVLNGNFLWANVALTVSGVVPLIINLFLYKQLHGKPQAPTTSDSKKQIIMH